MNDQLEDFVQKHRQAFDDREPSGRVWRRVQERLVLKDKQSWKQPVFWWRAAAIFFMALSAWLLVPREHLKAENMQAMVEFSDAEAFYIQQISNKVEMIDQFGTNDGLNGFTHDFHQLEAMYQVLKEEMKTRPSQKVKDALVLNLLVRIDLLNQHLHRLEEAQTDGEKEPVKRKPQRST